MKTKIKTYIYQIFLKLTKDRLCCGVNEMEPKVWIPKKIQIEKIIETK